jgi:hypothetical protein
MTLDRAWTLALSGCALLGLAGCGPDGPEIAYVSGRVTLDGKPLAGASIVFIPENGRPSGARTDPNGNYVLNFDERRKGAIPGKSLVRITTIREAEQDENGKVVTPASPERIPMRYNTNSELFFVVEPKKKNVANFDLKSGGPIASSE